jgi:WD40 repeat protein
VVKSSDERTARSEATKVFLGIGIVLLLLVLFWPIAVAAPEDSDIVALSFSAAGETLLAGTQGGEIFLLNVRDGSVLGSWQTRRSWFDLRLAPFNSIALDPGAEFAVHAGITLTIIVFDRTKPAPKIDVPTLAYGGAAVSPIGKRVAAISSAERLLVWNLDGPSGPLDFGKADAGVYGATVFSPDGKRLALAGHTLKMLYAQSGTEVWSRPRDNYASLCVAFRPDGKVLATGSQDSTIRLWNAETGDELSILRGHQGYVDRLSFSPDGERIASWARDGQLFLWDLVTPARLRTNLDTTKGGVAFSPDGRWIASGEARKTVGLWDAQTGKKIRDLPITTQPSTRSR